MAKNSLDPEELFRKSEDEMSDIEKMMAEILSESEENGRKKSTGEPKQPDDAAKAPSYASPAPPPRARKVSDASSSGSRVEKAVPDTAAVPRRLQNRTAPRSWNVRRRSKRRLKNAVLCRSLWRLC